MRATVTAAVAAVLLAAATAPAGAAGMPARSGELDSSFAGDGTVTQDVFGDPERAVEVVVTGAGEIVAAVQGGFALHGASGLVRYRDDGSLAGVFALPLPYVGNLVALPDGKLLALVDTVDGVAVVRVTSDGTPDPGFGNGGLAVVPRRTFGRPDCLGARHVAATQDGGVLIAGVLGCGGEAGGPMSTFVARLRADGSLDRSFANRGVRVTGDCASAGVAEWRDGRILLATGTGTDDYCYDGAMKVARLTRDGRPDRRFGRRGRIQVRFPDADDNTPRVMAIDGQRRIVLAGAAGRHVGVARLTRSGRLDRSFGDDGLAVRRTRWRLIATGVAVAADGAVTLTAASSAAEVVIDFAPPFSVLRFAADGDPDPGFGARGLRKVPFGADFAAADAVALDAQGRAVVAGHVWSPRSKATGYDIALARLR